jgi:hypothetical protein
MAHPIYEAAAIASKTTAFPTNADRLEERDHEIDVHNDGYSARELRFVYECIHHPDSLKGPFTTTLAPDMLPVATRAVRYFTNTDLRVLGTDHATGRLIIQSIGQT